MKAKKEKFECDTCGCYFYVKDRNNFMCPNCESECVECKRMFKQERDLQLCDKCVTKFDLDKLWKLHDQNKLEALDFNESKQLREKFRIEKIDKYEKAYHILMEYWDNFGDEDKEDINRELKKIGL